MVVQKRQGSLRVLRVTTTTIRTISFRIWNQRDPKVPPPCLTRTNSRFRKEAVPETAGVHRNQEYLDLQQKRESECWVCPVSSNIFAFFISFLSPRTSISFPFIELIIFEKTSSYIWTLKLIRFILGRQ